MIGPLKVSTMVDSRAVLQEKFGKKEVRGLLGPAGQLCSTTLPNWHTCGNLSESREYTKLGRRGGGPIEEVFRNIKTIIPSPVWKHNHQCGIPHITSSCHARGGFSLIPRWVLSGTSQPSLFSLPAWLLPSPMQ